MDVHKRETQVCITEGAVRYSSSNASARSARGSPQSSGDRPRAQILLETSTESEWVAQAVEGRGHAVVVADPE